MKYTIEFEVEEGNCELYKQFNKNDADSACKTCILRNADYCMDLNMHKAKIINCTLEDRKEEINEEPIDNTIVLTRYYEDYEKEHKWFVNMLKHQEQYKNCTDEEIEEIWKDHIKEKYTFDEIWSTIQCEGYTKIVLRMGRHDIQPDYDYVLETKEYIDKKMKKYL